MILVFRRGRRRKYGHRADDADDDDDDHDDDDGAGSRYWVFRGEFLLGRVQSAVYNDTSASTSNL